ncbi:MAG: META domain-containing protein [Rhodobacteraceae bacterium]|nr:META domain-containing protein [Paracoccaceae bacterium]
MLLTHIKTLLATAILAISASAGLAEGGGPDYFKVVDVAHDDVLNIRAESNAGAAKLGEIPPWADGIQNLGCIGAMTYAEYESASDAERAAGAQRGWCNIAYDGIVGWVAKRFLAEGAAPKTRTYIALTGSVYTTWSVAMISDTPTAEMVEITFAPDGTISGSTGCNRFNSRVRISGDMLIVDTPFAMTKMACRNEASAMQEQAFIALLESGPRLIFDPVADRMELVSDSNGTRAVLIPN